MKGKSFGLLIALIAPLIVLGSRAGAHAQSPGQVGLVVQFGSGEVLTRCVTFTGQEISGYDVLARAGLRIVIATSAGMGAAICKIEDEGCPAEDCFCRCKGENCVYWSYWHLSGENWVYSNQGASNYRARHGAVEGWRWGTGDPPPVIPFDQICAPAATETPLPTATPTMPPPSVSFEVRPETIVVGDCAQLVWRVRNVRAVYLGGAGVGGEGSRQVCPSQTHAYELRVVSDRGEARYTVTLNVLQPTPTSTPSPSSTPTPSPALIPSPTASERTPSPTPQPTDTPLPPPTPSATPTARHPTSTPGATPTPTRTPTVTFTPVPPSLLTYVPSPVPVRPTPTAVNARPMTIPKERLFFLACLIVLLAVSVVALRRGG